MKPLTQISPQRCLTTLFAVGFASLLLTTESYGLFEKKKIENFTMKSVTKDAKGKVINNYTMYYSPDAFRMDGMPGMGQGMPGGSSLGEDDITILVLTKQKKQYIYNHQDKIVFEEPLNEEELSFTGLPLFGDDVQKKEVGKDKVAGYKCIKNEIVQDFNIMGMKQQNKWWVWENEQFDFPLKSESSSGVIQEAKKIKTGKPNKKLFRPMTGYRNVDNMMAALAMDFGKMMRDEDEEEDDDDCDGDDDGDDEDIDPQQAMQAFAQQLEQMEKLTGESMSPEEKEQFLAIIGGAMEKAANSVEGKDAAKALWKHMTKRSGDEVLDGLKIGNSIDVVLGSKAKLTEVFSDYQKRLGQKGWEDAGMYVQKEEGYMSMTQGTEQLRFSYADNPGTSDKTYRTCYSIHYMDASEQ